MSENIKYPVLFLSLAIIFIAGIVVAQTEEDVIAPAAISDLAPSEVAETSVTLTWTAPGDDAAIGTSTVYDLRYYTETITDDNWASTTLVAGLPTPLIAGSAETFVVTGLTGSTTYYFAIKAEDEADNVSLLSNVATATTLAPVVEPEPEPVYDLNNIEMNLTPETLNIKSQGRWITVHLFLPAGYLASNVDISSIKLNGTLSPNLNFKGLNRFYAGELAQGSRSSSIVIKFSRSEIVNLIGSTTGSKTITITGKMKDGKTFSATDAIEVIGAAVEEDGALIMATSSPEVYVVKNGRKRHIPSAFAFEKLGYRWNNIKKISKKILDSYSEDELLKASDGSAVYIIIAGMKRHIPSAEVFESYGFNWDDISVIPKAELENYPDVILIRGAGDVKVFLLAGGKKHWIPSVAVFNSKGYKWDMIILVNSTEVSATPEDEPVE